MLRPMPGLRRQGGQTRQWLDDLWDWADMSLPQLVRAAEDKFSYRKLVHAASYARLTGTVHWHQGVRFRSTRRYLCVPPLFVATAYRDGAGESAEGQRRTCMAWALAEAARHAPGPGVLTDLFICVLYAYAILSTALFRLYAIHRSK